MRAILTFHDVNQSGSVLSIAPDELRSLIRAIRRSGHEVVPLCDLLDGEIRPNQIALTFDDGLRGVYEHALPIFRADEIPATVFLTTDFVGRTNRWPSLPPDAPTMTMLRWSELEELQTAGWTIEAHTATHPDLRRLDDYAIQAELQHADEAIETRLGRRPRVFAYPYGSWTPQAHAAVAARYDYAVTTEMRTLPTIRPDPHLVPRLETYYFRSTRTHGRFGTLPFSAYLATRRSIRTLRRTLGVR